MNKDVYLYLIEFMSDIDALNMLSVNKKFSTYFQYVLEKRYPLLIRFKKFSQSNKNKKKETWRLFFIKIVFSLEKLKLLGIPYIPNKFFNPYMFHKKYAKKKFLNFRNRKENIYDKAMFFAAQIGDANIVQEMINKGALYFEYALHEGVINNHINIVKLMLEKGGVISEDYALILASERGFMDIAKCLIDYGARSFNESMMDAAFNGHLEMVKLMVKNGGSFFEPTLNAASKKGHFEIVKLMVEHGAKNFSQGIEYTPSPKIREYLTSLL